MQSRKITSTKGNSSVKTQTLASFCHVPSGSPSDCLLLHYLLYSLPSTAGVVPVLGTRTMTAQDGTLGRSERQPGSPLAISPTTRKSKGFAHTIAGVCVQYRSFPVQEHRCGRSAVSAVAAEPTALTRHSCEGSGFYENLCSG